jgi:transcription-repair coupling factor (superfamily II helicase)
MSELQTRLPKPNATPGTEGALELLRKTLAEGRRASISQVRGAMRGWILARALRAEWGPVVAVAADEESADALAADLAFFLGGAGTRQAPKVLRLPGDDVLPYDELSPSHTLVQERLAALYHLRRGTPTLRAVVLSAKSLAHKVVPAQRFESLCLEISKDKPCDRDALARQLVGMGYQSAPMVEDPGSFSVRGGLLDVWSPTSEKPVRVELFGDTVEVLKSFDPETQRTIEEIRSIALCPAAELLFTAEGKQSARTAALQAADEVNRPTSKTRELLDAVAQGIPSVGVDALLPRLYPEGLDPLQAYLPSGKGVFFVDDPIAVDRALHELQGDLESSYTAARERGDIALPISEHFLSAEKALSLGDARRRIDNQNLVLEGLGGTEPTVVFGLDSTVRIREEILGHHGEDGALSPLVDHLRAWRDEGTRAAIVCGTAGQAEKLKRLLLDRNTMVKVHTEPFPTLQPESLRDPSIWAHLYVGEISSGFVDPAGQVAIVSDEDIFGARQRRPARHRRTEQPFVEGFRELKEGDLIVHVDFGIGRYLGLVKKQLAGVLGDFLLLEYAGGDKVYLPVYRMRQVQRFMGSNPDSVRLDKLGGTSWEKTKKRVKEELLKMAGELLRIYAARKAHPGFHFSEPDRFYRQFESEFEFEPTPDQQKAIDDVLSDMTSGKVMDRLVCGDVGYGKTEVALRAAFKAVLDHKQVAVLVPTTVLAAQHGMTFGRRFKDYPVRVEVISRMRKPEEVRATLRRAALGQVDILIGTHRLLGNDITFKDLGLVIVDEEQRFGVKHKEALKKLRTQVDVLTLTATPIPRTLHMSMAGVRDMSIIATPPADRKSIRTLVMKFDPVQIAEAIRREMGRGGQVYFVHNRVQSIAAMERFLHELVPEARIAVGHGQMAEGRLEEVMTAFVERRYDILLCSSIIESGLDIPSANTIIVNRADGFGLAQLYQIRGRVGRSAQRAYALLLIPAKRPVTPDAVRRLEVLQAFTELGAGFTIASHDLEIRGAGNLLGPDQSGTIAAVGFDLYAQLLDEAVRELKGEPPREELDPDVTLPLPAFLPDGYVEDVHQRLVLYKRFSQISGDDDLGDLRAELVDRFGEIPVEVDNLSELMRLKVELRRLHLRALEWGPGRLVLTLGQAATIDPAKLAGFIQRARGAYKLTPDMKLVARIPEDAEGPDLIAEAHRVLRALGTCV